MTTKFEKGDRVGIAHFYAPGRSKRRLGEVVNVGHRGVQVRFDDDGEELWKPAGTVLFESGSELVKDRPATPRTPRHVTDAPHVVPAPEPVATVAPPSPSAAPAPTVTPAVRPAPVAPPAAVTPPTITNRDVLLHMEASGVDLLSLWHGIAETVRARQREAVAKADTAVKSAAQEVADAEALLSEAKGRLAAAVRAQEDATNALRDVIAQTGGQA